MLEYQDEKAPRRNRQLHGRYSSRLVPKAEEREVYQVVSAERDLSTKRKASLPNQISRPPNPPWEAVLAVLAVSGGLYLGPADSRLPWTGKDGSRSVRSVILSSEQQTELSSGPQETKRSFSSLLASTHSWYLDTHAKVVVYGSSVVFVAMSNAVPWSVLLHFLPIPFRTAVIDFG